MPANSPAAIALDMSLVGNPGNLADTTGYGVVGNYYKIGTYEVLNSQYAAFLNAVASKGMKDPNALYNTQMNDDARGGITRGLDGTGTNYTYTVKVGRANNPVVFVSYYDSLRFANWIQNGQPTGYQVAGTTETGTYTMADPTLARNPGTDHYFALASENEWYKAAYYNGTLASYYLYPTRNNAIPNSRQPNGIDANSANFYRYVAPADGVNDGYAVTLSQVYNGAVNYLTDGGAFSLTKGFYGTYDQAGNVMEWNDVTGAGNRPTRGGSWDQAEIRLRSTTRPLSAPGFESASVGFRIAYIPEPSTYILVGAGVLLLFMRRRFAAR